MKFLLMIMILSIQGYALATPAKFSQCEQHSKLKHVSWGSGVFFSEDCGTVYVLPPVASKFNISGLSLSGGDISTDCKAYELAKEGILSTEKTAKNIKIAMENGSERLVQLTEYQKNGLLPLGYSYVDLLEEVSAITNYVMTLESQIVSMSANAVNGKAKYGLIEGAHVSFSFISRHNDLVSEYQKLNPELHFERMPLEQSYLAITEKDNSNEILSTRMSAIHSITVPLVDSVISEEGENGVVKLPGKVFTDGASGQMVVSLIGACGFKDIRDDVDAANKVAKSFLAIDAVYQYQVQVQRKHKVEMNLRQLAERIEKVSSKGGFLSRKNIHKLTEKTEHESWIKVTSVSNDADFKFDDEYTQSVVKEEMSKFLEQIAHVRFGVPGSYPKAEMPDGESGAANAAGALSKCPHMYCQIGSYGLKFLDATFGSKTALSEYLKMEDAWSERIVDEKQMTKMVGSFTFE